MERAQQFALFSGKLCHSIYYRSSISAALLGLLCFGKAVINWRVFIFPYFPSFFCILIILCIILS